MHLYCGYVSAGIPRLWAQQFINIYYKHKSISLKFIFYGQITKSGKLFIVMEMMLNYCSSSGWTTITFFLSPLFSSFTAIFFLYSFISVESKLLIRFGYMGPLKLLIILGNVNSSKTFSNFLVHPCNNILSNIAKGIGMYLPTRMLECVSINGHEIK